MSMPTIKLHQSSNVGSCAYKCTHTNEISSCIYYINIYTHTHMLYI